MLLLNNMNRNTKLALKDFATAVQNLAQGTIHMIGVDEATKIIEVSEELKNCLDKDETIE